MNRCTSFGIILAVSLMSVCSAHGQASAPKEESVRTVISKVSSIGTHSYNSSAKDVSAKGVRMSTLVNGERWVMGSGGNFSATEKVSQLNFVLPARLANADTNTTICLERLEALRLTGSKTKLELNFAGYKQGDGNYIVTNILGCGEIQQPTVLPAVKPTPKPTSTPRPTVTPAPKK